MPSISTGVQPGGGNERLKYKSIHQPIKGKREQMKKKKKKKKTSRRDLLTDL